MTDYPRYNSILITGGGGFVGRHLLDLLQQSENAPRQIVALDVKIKKTQKTPSNVQWLQCDLTDFNQTKTVINDIAPDGIIHLAGISTGDQLSVYFDLNVKACNHVLSAASGLKVLPRVLVVGSAAEYGITSGQYEVVEETDPLLSQTPYGLSKIIQEQWALLYYKARSLPVICVRPFNIVGPGQSEHLVPAAFMHQIRDVLKGKAKEVKVGNLSTERDFTDVRDVVAAIWKLMGADGSAVGQVFNICSGRATKISDMLEVCIELSGQKITITQDSSRLKKYDVPSIIGSVSKLEKFTDWYCKYTLQCSLQDMWQQIKL